LAIGVTETEYKLILHQCLIARDIGDKAVWYSLGLHQPIDVGANEGTVQFGGQGVF
jgi:hypothetical protein